jgi:hypothetical protein
MFDFDGVKRTIDQFLQATGNHRNMTMIVMGPDLYEEMKEEAKKIANIQTSTEPQTVFGVEIVVRDEIPGGLFGILHKDCMDHLDEHLEELVDMLEEDPEEAEEADGTKWIQCDLCKHPINTIMAVGDDLKCPWCGDVNDLEDIRNGEY